MEMRNFLFNFEELKYRRIMNSVRVLLLVLISLLSVETAEAQKLKDLLNKAKKEVLGEDDVGLGLKQALEFGVEEAVNKLSAENGYLLSPYKILVPKEAQQVISKLKIVPGFENVERDLIQKMNEAAEIAAKEATPIFVSAITSMTFDDAMNILMGEKDAATRYLERTTRDQLYVKFMPVIQVALDQVNAREYWKTAVDAYNRIPLVRKVNPELDDHVNNKALDGLFGEIEVKEEKIRGNASERKTELLRKVFAQQDARD
ncbi:MAG: DUF4197 domain-containing protein [Saprospiraceae bacterium]|nr:DUF4197 domain-containing protein [Saprospiraceae bacterium]